MGIDKCEPRLMERNEGARCTVQIISQNADLCRRTHSVDGNEETIESKQVGPNDNDNEEELSGVPLFSWHDTAATSFVVHLLLLLHLRLDDDYPARTC
jgi:hypothetical protein